MLAKTVTKLRISTRLHAIRKSNFPSPPTRKATKPNTIATKTSQQQPADQLSQEPSPLIYQLVAGFNLAAGLGSFFMPAKIWSALGSTDVTFVTETSTAILAVYLLIAAAATYRLSLAAAECDLDAPINAKLNLYLGLASAAYGVPLLKGAALGSLDAVPASAAAAAFLLTSITAYAPGYIAGGGNTNVPELIAGLGQGLKGTVKGGRGLAGILYTLNFWEDFILGAALIGGPILPTVADQITGTSIVAKELVGIGTLLYAGCVWLLLEALDKGRLGNPTARTLNIALGSVSAIVGLAAYSSEAAGLPANPTNIAVVTVSCALTAAVYLGLGLKPPAGDE